MEAGADIMYDYQNAGGEWKEGAVCPGPTWMRSLLGDDFFAHVVWVDLSGWNVDNGLTGSCSDHHFDDEDAQLLEKLPRVTFVDTSNSHLTDDGLRYFTRLHRLETLYLSSPYITDAGLSHLACMKRVKEIVLYCPRVTDAGAQWLADQLPDTAVVNAGFVVSFDASDDGGAM
jgi:hypothetical protein